MLTIGDRVLARRDSEDYWYPGTIRHSDGSRFYVIFDDGEDALLAPAALRLLQLEPGDHIFVRRADREYAFGEIVDRADDRLRVTFDDGEKIWTGLAQVRVGPKPKQPTTPAAVPAGQWQVCDRVLACWFDLDWYPGIVLGTEADRVLVLLDNGAQAMLTPESVRPLTVAAGDRVLCRAKGGADYHPGALTGVEGEKVHVRYDDGDEEWTSVRLLRLQRDEWFAAGAGRAVGDRVLARWYDLFWYPGVILSVEGKRIHIAFDDGDQALVTPDKVQELDIAVGDRVFCRLKGGPYYHPGEVVAQNGEKIHVRYDDGNDEWTSVRMVRVER
jgi:hypothetical protein